MNLIPLQIFIVLKFVCPFCGEENETDALYVPTPDFSAETHHDSNLMKCISIRHDIVHRNGKDKDGNLRIINKDDVLNIATSVSEFILNIENQLTDKDIDNTLKAFLLLL